MTAHCTVDPMSTAWRGEALGMPAWVQRLTGQFGKPSGLVGELAGWLMAKTNKANAWVVELVDVRPGDRVLEVGFGPGVAISLAAAQAGDGRVVGVEVSEVMLRQAQRRNRQAIQAGRVELRLGDVHALPFADGAFTRAYSLHSLYFWRSLDVALAELHRVLTAGGRLVLAGRLHRPEASAFDPSRYGLKDADVRRIAEALEEAGFQPPRQEVRELGRETVIAFVAERPPLS